MSRFGSQYSIGRAGGTCAASGRTLEPGERIVAALVENEEGALERVDHAETAWEEGHRPDGLFSHWRTVVPEAGERRTPFVDDEVLEDLFDRLAEDERDDRIAFRFVLGLILMRQRRLRFTGKVAGDVGVETWLMRRRGQDPETDSIRLVNPGLGDDDVAELTAQLGEILQGELA